MTITVPRQPTTPVSSGGRLTPEDGPMTSRPGTRGTSHVAGRERRAVYSRAHIGTPHDGMARAEAPEAGADGIRRIPEVLADRSPPHPALAWEQIDPRRRRRSTSTEPQPWARTGPGTAKDGKPRFDLERFDPAFFDRLRSRMIAAGKAGVYVGVMLFDGWALHLSPPPDQIEGHPFHALNNVNGIAATSIDDLQVLARRRVDSYRASSAEWWTPCTNAKCCGRWPRVSGDGTVGEESPSFLHGHYTWATPRHAYGDRGRKDNEARRGYECTRSGDMQFPVANQTRVNEPLLRGRAEGISPGYDEDVFTAAGKRRRRRATVAVVAIAGTDAAQVSSPIRHTHRQGDAFGRGNVRAATNRS